MEDISFMDKFNVKYKDEIEQVAFNILKNIRWNYCFILWCYNTFTLKSEDEDDLRKIGFSKDGKFQSPNNAWTFSGKWLSQ